MAKGWTISQVFVRTWMDRRTNQTVATPEERGRYKKSSKISLSKEGIQGPRTQVPDFREAKHRYLQLYIEHVERTGEGNSPIHLAQKQDIIVNNLKVSRSTTTQLIPELDGDCTLQSVYWKAARQLEVESKLGFLVILTLDGTVKFFMSKSPLAKIGHKRPQQAVLRHRLSGKSRRNKVSKYSFLHRRTCCQGDFDTFFFLFR